MSRGWYWKSGDWNLICDVCAKKIKASESKKRWDGLIVCKADFETRHPMDFIRARVDRMTVPFSRPQGTDVFRGVCDVQSVTAIPRRAKPGCVTPNYISPAYDSTIPVED